MAAKVRCGTYTGTGASLNIEVGFIPDFLIITNITDGTPITVWYDGMTAATSVDIAAAAASNADNSITRFTGTAGTVSQGFSTGTDNSVNAKVYRYFATQSM